MNDYPDFTEFDAANNTAATVLREQIVYNWEVKYIGVDATQGNATGSNKAVVSDPIKTYTVLDIPESPWDVADDFTTDDTNQPWVTALEFATAPTKANASGQNDEGSLTEITNLLFRQSKDTDSDGQIDQYGHDLVYACRDGDPEYVWFHVGPSWSMDFSGYMSKKWGATINCFDQAGAVTIVARLLGIDAEYAYMEPFGYLNPTHLLGIPGPCNNPFLRESNPPTAQLMGINDTSRTLFTRHGFARYNGKNWDACSGPDDDHGYTGVALATYLATVIDTSVDPEEKDAAGDSGDIIIVPYDVARGIT